MSVGHPYTSMPSSVAAASVAWWWRLAPELRRMVLLALVLLASGVLHAGFWAVDGGAWSGPVSWRKPIVFGLSGGVTTLSLAWVGSHLPAGRGRRLSAGIYTVAMGLVVFLITLQRWRGVGSHFNEETLFDALVFGTMGLCIHAITGAVVYWTIQSFRSRELPAEVAAALRGGLLLLLGACAIGYLMIAHGTILLQRDPAADPTVFGDAGRMIVPHALGLHAIQALPLLVWLLRGAPLAPARRARLVRFAAGGYALVWCITVVQMLAGRAPLDLGPLTAVLGAAAQQPVGHPLRATAPAARGADR